MSKFKYLRIKKGNIKTFRELNALFAVEFGDPIAYESKKPTVRYLSKLIAKPHFIAIVAIDKNQVVGGLVAYVLEKFEQQRSEIYIYDLAVKKSFRRKGIATNLIRELQKIGKKLGAYVIFVQADKVDKPAVALYSSLGVKESPYHFDIKI